MRHKPLSSDVCNMQAHLILVIIVLFYCNISLLSTVHLETGSPVPSLWYSRPWLRLWKRTLRCMSWENASEKVYNCIPPNQLSLTCHHRTMASSSLTRSYGLSTTLMYTEWPFTRCVTLYLVRFLCFLTHVLVIITHVFLVYRWWITGINQMNIVLNCSSHFMHFHR